MNNSSEIELAIKIGKLIYEPNEYDSKQLARTIEILDVRLDIEPKRDIDLSLMLRPLIEHKGDVSFERFIKYHLENITLKDRFRWYHMQQLAYFIRGIGYLYPPQSMIFRVHGKTIWNESFCLPGVSNHEEFYNYGRNLIEEVKKIKEANKTEANG